MKIRVSRAGSEETGPVLVQATLDGRLLGGRNPRVGIDPVDRLTRVGKVPPFAHPEIGKDV